MKLIWVARNMEKVEAHGVTPSEVETVKKPTIEELVAGFDEEVARVEAKFGPQVQGRIVRPGRPLKGTTVVPTGTHCLRVPDPVWAAMKAKAAATGVSLNQAANLAMLEWARH